MLSLYVYDRNDRSIFHVLGEVCERTFIGQIIGPAAGGSAGPVPTLMLNADRKWFKTNKNDRTIVKKVNIRHCHVTYCRTF